MNALASPLPLICLCLRSPPPPPPPTSASSPAPAAASAPTFACPARRRGLRRHRRHQGGRQRGRCAAASRWPAGRTDRQRRRHRCAGAAGAAHDRRRAATSRHVARAPLQRVGVSSCGPFVLHRGLVELATPNICGGLAGPARGLPNDWMTAVLEAPLRPAVRRRAGGKRRHRRAGGRAPLGRAAGLRSLRLRHLEHRHRRRPVRRWPGAARQERQRRPRRPHAS